MDSRINKETILLLGDINIDTVWPVSEFPIPGRDGLVDTVVVETGGAVLNSAIILDHLGQSTSLLGSIGDDVWAEKIREDVKGTSIDLSQVQIDARSTTGLTFIIATEDGERTMFSYRGANIQLNKQHLQEATFQRASLLQISGYALLKSPQKEAVWRAVELAKKYNVPISLDTGLEPAIKNTDDLRKLLSCLSVCISGPEEIEVLLGTSSAEEAADSLISLGIDLVAIKLGKKGSIVANSGKQIFCPSFNVDAVDTTGAGDSFSAGLLYGWINGWDLSACGVFANALGALAASTYGAGFSLPMRSKMVQFLQSKSNEPAALMCKGLHGIIKTLSK